MNKTFAKCKSRYNNCLRKKLRGEPFNSLIFRKLMTWKNRENSLLRIEMFCPITHLWSCFISRTKLWWYNLTTTVLKRKFSIIILVSIEETTETDNTNPIGINWGNATKVSSLLPSHRSSTQQTYYPMTLKISVKSLTYNLKSTPELSLEVVLTLKYRVN